MDEKVKYIGVGFINGVPTRDLTIDEWKALDNETRNLCLSSGNYKVDDKPVKKSEPVKGE